LAKDGIVVVAGMGEVGRPLSRILSRQYECVGVDVQPVEITKPCSVLHLCFPFQIPDFVGTAARYVLKYQPALTIINSTIAPGTTRKVQEAVGEFGVAYSPVRGKHARMDADMLRYKKFVASTRPEVMEMALDHFSAAGFKTGIFRTPEIAFLPAGVYPGHIGGHCVMPNIRILQSQIQSDFLDAVVRSNQLVEERQTLEATAEVTK